ncbi:unnamed protein product [Rotaria sp. Silwood2]|nr:unnamed protein product [Rotaria sp. Silwood2]CAF4375487.1 unnamed protein product [Rotaria sp. Silwood2]
MSVIELIPLDKGSRFILDNTIVTTIGRTANIGCLDKKISRNHAELYVKPDETLWIKPIHHNPTFYKTKTNQLITLTKDEEFQLNDNDEIGLLPNEYFYRISIKSKDKQDEQIDSSTISKSPIQQQEEEESSSIQEKEFSPVRNYDKERSSNNNNSNLEPEGGIILHTNRALPVWMSKSSIPEEKTPKGRGKGKSTVTPTKPSPSPSKYRTYIGRKKAEGIVYDDDEESNEEPATTTTIPSKDQNNQMSSTVNGSNKRERCPFGKFCYRKNPAHRQEAIHPGDPDWDNKENDTDDKKPECPYGSDCYRKNPDHFNEYNHTQQQLSINKTKRRISKRKGSDNEENDDDGLPNEYDYNDSFIDDEDLNDSARIDRTGGSQMNPDNDWKPSKKTRHSDNDENNSTDEDEINLLQQEAAEFVEGSSINHQRPAKKKARIYIPDEND